MARPWVLVSLMLLIVFTSQLEWKQQFGNETEAVSSISQKERQKQQHGTSKREVVKEKIILSQEKSIQKLKELVQSLREQLQQCRSENSVVNGTKIPLSERFNDLEQQMILED